MTSGVGQFVTHIGACELPDGPPGEVRGHWVRCTDEEYVAAIDGAGGLAALHVWSSLTDLDGRYGSPFAFTCWGTDDVPIAACGGAPGTGRALPCPGTHARFVPVLAGCDLDAVD